MKSKIITSVRLAGSGHENQKNNKTLSKTIKLLLCFLSITTFSCSTDSETETTAPSNRQKIDNVQAPHASTAILNGTWTWEITAGGLAGTVETPASTGTTKQIIFSGNHSYHLTTNGVTTSQGTYMITSKYCIHSAINKPAIDFSDPMLDNQTVEHISLHNLSLSDDYYDGYGSSYLK